MGEVYVLASGFQLAIFLATFGMSFLIRKDKIAKIFRIIAGAFVILALFDFIHVFANIYSEIWPWLSTRNNLCLVTHPLLLLNGFLFLFFLNSLKKRK